MKGALEVAVTRLNHGADLPLPAYASEQAAGMDLQAAVTAPRSLHPGDRALIPTGIAIALPPGYEAQVRPRSGLAVQWGLTVLNAPGTIDADYRGEIQVPLINLGQNTMLIERGMRIAQMVVAPVTGVLWRECGVLPNSERGANGFGSTGLKSQ